VIPASDDPIRTEVRVTVDEWISFQQYFVQRGQRDDVLELRFAGSERAAPAPGVMEAILDSDIVVIGPSNPPLSIWPILAVDQIRAAVSSHPRVVGVSPLFGGKPLKGPADRVMASLGLSGGNAGVVEAYDGLLDLLIVDIGDSADIRTISSIEVRAEDTRIGDTAAGRRLAEAILHR
jgi:LPPG:FO 2-phospho-L-lactate transferase